MWLWRLRSQSYSHLCAKWRSRKADGGVQFKSTGLRTKGAESINPGGVKVQQWSTSVQGQEESGCFISNKEKIGPSSAFCSIWAFSGPDDADPHWWRSCFLLSLLIQMLTSPGNILTGTPRNHILPAIWASLIPVKLTYKIKYRKILYTAVWSLKEKSFSFFSFRHLFNGMDFFFFFFLRHMGI